MTERLEVIPYLERHRDACAARIGLSPMDVADACNPKMKGAASIVREKLVVAMRETPVDPSGAYLSFPEIAKALRRRSHSTFVEAYHRAKAKARQEGK